MDIPNEELNFAVLEADLNRATAAYEAAKQEANKRKEECDTAANLLAQAHAAKAGITVGTLVEFVEYGRGLSRARVEGIAKPRWVYYGNTFDLSVRVILRDGGEGKRLCIVESSYFLPTKGFGSPNGERPPRARIVNDFGEV